MINQKTVTETFAGTALPLDLFEKSAFEKLKKMVKDKLGLDCDGYREEYVRRRFEIRLRETTTFTYSKYVVYLNKHPEEFDALLNNLAINYTSFFRDRDVYLHIERTIFPALFTQPAVRIWSAGSSTGQEPYSLAMLALKVREHQKYSCRVTIYASDVDKEALAEAAKGVYAINQLEGVENWMIKKYFIQKGETFTVKDEVKALVRFGNHDLMKPYLQSGFDLVLCRNVMIYFAKEAQQMVHMNIFNALRMGGFFISGKTEMLSGEPAAKFKLDNVSCRVYKKPSLI